MKAIDAKYEAQKIAFAPFVFQTCVAMKELKIFDVIRKERGHATLAKISEQTGVSVYGVRVLVEMANAAEVIHVKEDETIELTKVGMYMHSDMMTNVNLYFTQDVCYQGLFHLTESIRSGKPSGLKELGNWETVYQGLSLLPEKIKTSWLEFDHYYSDDAFGEALKILFSNQPKKMVDIGGNTGKWAIASCKHSADVNVQIVDLPGQIKLAQDNINSNTPFGDRISYYPTNILNAEESVPQGADIYWMSQFLDCFSEEEIELILSKVFANAREDSMVYIMETFIDNQKFPAAHFSLVATSLYFTNIANGNSKMYAKSVFIELLNRCGFELVNEYELIGDSYHTILACRKK